MPSLALRRALTVLLAALIAGGAQGQPRTLLARHLTPADGLSSLRVDAVAHPPGGPVWIVAGETLDRYDGARLGPSADDDLGGRPVRLLAASEAGALWAATDAALWRRDAGTHRFALVADVSATQGAPRVLLPDGEGVWVGTDRAVTHVSSSGRPRPVGPLTNGPVRALAKDGPVLVAATEGGLTRFDLHARRVRRDRRRRGLTALAVRGDTLWAGDSAGRVERLHPATLQPSGVTAQLGAAVSSMMASRAHPGVVWGGTRGSGLWAVGPGGVREVAIVRKRDGRVLRGVHVLSVEEHDGTLSLGTTDGLLQAEVSRPRFHSATYATDRPDGLRTPNVMSVHASRRDPGVVWVGTVGGGLHRYHWAMGRADRWFGDPSHPLSVPFAIHETAGGALWLGGTAPTLFRFDPATGHTESVPLAPDRGGYVTDIVPVRGTPDALWVATSEAGLFRLDTATRQATALDGPGAPTYVWTADAFPDAPGVLYTATQGAGLMRLDVASGRWARVEPAGCALDDRLVSLAAAPGRVLWIGSFENRLFRVDLASGTCRVWGAAEGLPDESVGGVFLDGHGAVWVSTNAGLARLDPEADVITRFDAADGLPSDQLYYHARDQTPTGEILVGGVDGFAAFDPAAVEIDTTAAPVRLTSVRVDGERVPLAEALNGLRLPHDRNDLAVEFAGTDLRRPDAIRYRVRLVGAEDRWHTTDRAEARYPLLPPGQYTLRVAATNRDGYWSEPTDLAVRILPPYWLRPWFWALVAGLVGAVGLVAHRYRVAQLLRVERTRRRIADDLHDDIGSKISSVALRLDAARLSPTLPEAERARLAHLGDTARAVVADLRDTVWLVDAGHDDLSSVADRMEQFARHTLEGGRGTVERGPVPKAPLDMEARRDLYLRFTEALHNAVRHAEAGRVAVRIGSDDDAFRFEVADDGRGFDPAAGGAGRGMRTMRRRADALGATLAVDSAPGEGARVAVRVLLRALSTRYRAND